MRLSENTRIRKYIMILLSIQLTLSMAMVSFASGANYAENAAKWGFEQAFWVILFVTLIVAAGAWMKHALSAAIVTVIGILAYICKQPEVISTIGNAVGSRVFGG
jgi:hypothetical protein